ncbi:MAG: hypothetical protein KDJ48_07280, partial [Nitratireductor sp.]|nr:hypothetical protein [Nitratireductor sp.]
ARAGRKMGHVTWLTTPAKG